MNRRSSEESKIAEMRTLMATYKDEKTNTALVHRENLKKLEVIY